MMALVYQSARVFGAAGFRDPTCVELLVIHVCRQVQSALLRATRAVAQKFKKLRKPAALRANGRGWDECIAILESF
jgi:hypothetical protein